MSIASLSDFKLYMREATTDLDATFQQALDSATAEVNSFLGMDAETDFGSGCSGCNAGGADDNGCHSEIG